MSWLRKTGSGLALLPLILTAGCLYGADAVSVVARDLPQYGLRLIAPASPQFETYFQLIAPSGRADSRLLAEKSRSVIFRNESTKTVLAFSIRLTQTDLTGWSTHGENLRGTGSEPQSGGGLEAGEMILLTPTQTLFTKPAGRFGLAPGITGGLLLGMSEIAQDVVSLDGALFDDGLFVGPNENHSFEKLQDQDRVPRDLASEVLAKHDAGMSDAELVLWLETVRNDKSSPTGTARTGAAFRVERQLARMGPKFFDEQRAMLSKAPELILRR